MFSTKIYGLPKILKDSALHSIVSTIHSPVSQLGIWLAAAYLPLFGTKRSYLNKSIDIANKLKTRHIDDNTILCSFDVVYVSTNCDVKRFYNKFSHGGCSGPKFMVCLRFISIVLFTLLCQLFIHQFLN